MPEEKKKILVVDDDPDMVFAIRQFLEAEGYEVTGVPDGEHALEALKNIEANLVICDVVLPGMDGLRLCKEIKKNQGASAIPILMLTGKDEAKDDIISYESGADKFIAKPFRNDDLARTVSELLKKK